MANDLKHRDWLLYSIQILIEEINPTINVTILDKDDGGKILIANQISEEDIGKLNFLVNTDSNNNYLYIENFEVFINGSFTPLQLPGLSTIVINMYRRSDILGFIAGKKLHLPFDKNNFKYSSYTGDINGFIDTYSSLIPYNVTTFGNVKTYQITLNPDMIVTDRRMAT
jgi:hypothetical protein